MEDLKRKYARFLIEGCLNLKEEDKLFITGSSFIKDFIDVVISEAKNLGIKHIETLINKPIEQKKLYLNKSYEQIICNPLMNKTKYNEMARKGYAFLNLSSPLPGFYDDIDPTLLNKVLNYQMKSIDEYRKLQNEGAIKWNISAVPNEIWASSIDEIKNVDKLWDYIFDICLIKEDDPKKSWQEKMKKLKLRADYLNDLKIDHFIYHNSLGTNLEIGLPENYIFHIAEEQNIVNMPSEEIFTSPNYKKVNGVVYSSKPLYYNGKLIENFKIEFKNGKIIDYSAEKGYEILKGIIDTDEGSHYLGELAFVDHISPISKTNIIFKNTLFDENASCHLAIGQSFQDCIYDGLGKSKDELLQMGLNQSRTHVDFFVGTSDLKVEAVLQNGRKLDIMRNGNFIKEEK